MAIKQNNLFIRICISLLSSSIFFTACVNSSSIASDLARIDQEITPTNTAQSSQGDFLFSEEINRSFGLTYHRLDGNRVNAGTGSEHIQSVDITLQGKPVWIVATALKLSSVWYVVLENGQVQAFRVTSNSVKELDPSIITLPSGMPPVLVADEQNIYLTPPPVSASPLTHSIFLQIGTEVFIDNAQQVHFKSVEDRIFQDVQALPDARILTDERDRVLLLSDPTENYTHSVLGDAIEAASVTLIDTNKTTFEIRKIAVETGDVIEGISPIWVDIDLDGEREIIVTQSNQVFGAKVVVYREDGSILAESKPIGKGFRWMHQIAVAQFIAGGPLELAVVKTPHIDGKVEILELVQGQLEVQASLSGYSTHKLGSRNLDAAVVADFNGDGIVELIVPGQEHISITGIQFSDGDLIPVWSQQLFAPLSTNLTVVDITNQLMLLGAGTEENTLKIWITN